MSIYKNEDGSLSLSDVIEDDSKIIVCMEIQRSDTCLSRCSFSVFIIFLNCSGNVVADGALFRDAYDVIIRCLGFVVR